MPHPSGSCESNPGRCGLLTWAFGVQGSRIRAWGRPGRARQGAQIVLPNRCETTDRSSTDLRDEVTPKERESLWSGAALRRALGSELSPGPGRASPAEPVARCSRRSASARSDSRDNRSLPREAIRSIPCGPARDEPGVANGRDSVPEQGPGGRGSAFQFRRGRLFHAVISGARLARVGPTRPPPREGPSHRIDGAGLARWRPWCDLRRLLRVRRSCTPTCRRPNASHSIQVELFP